MSTPRRQQGPGPPSLLPRPGQQPRINSIYDFSNRGLGELKAWMEAWFIPERNPLTTPALRSLLRTTTLVSRHGPIDSGPEAQTRIAHDLQEELIAVASPGLGSAEGVYVTGVTSSEHEIVIHWSQPNVLVSANVIGVLP